MPPSLLLSQPLPPLPPPFDIFLCFLPLPLFLPPSLLLPWFLSFSFVFLLTPFNLISPFIFHWPFSSSPSFAPPHFYMFFHSSLSFFLAFLLCLQSFPCSDIHGYCCFQFMSNPCPRSSLLSFLFFSFYIPLFPFTFYSLGFLCLISLCFSLLVLQFYSGQ